MKWISSRLECGWESFFFFFFKFGSVFYEVSVEFFFYFWLISGRGDIKLKTTDQELKVSSLLSHINIDYRFDLSDHGRVISTSKFYSVCSITLKCFVVFLKSAQFSFGEYILIRREKSSLTPWTSSINKLSLFSWLNKQTEFKEQHNLTPFKCLYAADPATFPSSDSLLIL